jgi:CRP/FNR family cyclic AMP-dependent transcriptional regulator
MMDFDAAAERMIAGSSWGAELSPCELRRVLASMEERTHDTGQVIAAEGELAAYWYGLMEGVARLSVGTSRFSKSTLEHGGADTWFGEGALVNAEVRRYQAVAVTRCHLVLLPRRTFEWLRSHSLAFNHYLQSSLATRVEECVALCAQPLESTIEDRILKFLDGCAAGDRKTLALTQSQLARLNGISRQRANLALARLRDAGLLSVERKQIGLTAAMHRVDAADTLSTTVPS